VPGSRAEVAAYYVDMQPQLAITREAAEALLFLTVPPMPWGLGLSPVRVGYTGVAVLALGLLPPWARRRYGLPALRATDPAASLTARGLRLAMAAVPQRLYAMPQFQAAMRRLRDAGQR
jgi:uncharacterized protein (DUF2236 family)